MCVFACVVVCVCVCVVEWLLCVCMWLCLCVCACVCCVCVCCVCCVLCVCVVGYVLCVLCVCCVVVCVCCCCCGCRRRCCRCFCLAQRGPQQHPAVPAGTLAARSEDQLLLPVALEATSQVSQVCLDLLPLTLFGGGPVGLHPVAAAGASLNNFVQGAGGLGHCDAPEPSSSGTCLLPSAKC